MADVPLPLFRAVSAGPFKTLAALWRHLRATQLHAARDRGERPWVYPSNRTLAEDTGRCKSSIEHDIGALRDAGWITRDVRGEVSGWRLTDPEGVDAPQKTAVDDEVTADNCGDPQKTAAAEDCGGAELTHEPADASASGPTRPRAALWLLPAEDCGGRERAAAAAAAARLAENCGAADGRRWDALELLAALAGLTPPSPAQRITADGPTRARARLLLDVPLEGLDEADALAARRERFEAVLATATAFAAICEAEPAQRRFWCGAMLELRGRRRDGDHDGPRALSRWQAIETTVADRQAVREQAERAASAAAERQALAAAEEVKRPTAAVLDAGLAELKQLFRQHGAG